MTHPTSTLIPLFKGMTFVLGGLITFYAFEAYRTSKNPSFRALSVGFGVVTLGAMTAGIADHVLPFPFDIALVIESAFTTLGFCLILYSLLVK